ncbi:MAG: D-alanine--D-alanine ligase [Ruminococcus sp.]|jgi:D-alanine-D-alanine ligase|nr:D-alanine--D-alanine ligase [Ruminococcus sp.]
MKKKIAVIFGGASSEHDISLVSAANVIRNISEDKYDVLKVGISKTGHWMLYPGPVSAIADGSWEKDPDNTSAILSPDTLHKGIIVINEGSVTLVKVDAIFPVLHGKNGEDGTVQGLFKLSGIPFVGCGVLSSAICMDKAMTHTVLDYNGIKTAKWEVINETDKNYINDICEKTANKLNYPLFVKPANAGSSIGVRKAENFAELLSAVHSAFTHDTKVIIEQFVQGREIEVAVFGYSKPFASLAGEIKTAGGFYDYESKYVNNTTELFIPAEIPWDVVTEIRETALKAYKVLNCKGLSRIDFFLTEQNEIILNEVNTLPGFTDISMYPKLMEKAGMSQNYLIEKLIEKAIDNEF